MRYIIDKNTILEDLLAKLKDNDELFFKEGVYKLKLSLNLNNLKIIGEDKEKTIITNNDHYHKIMNDYNECNTFRTYTLELLGDNNYLSNITIENTCDSKTYGQAVALAVYGDHFKCCNSIIKSEQDTLFTGPLPADLKIRYQGFLENDVIKAGNSKQIYENTKIIGDVDFIFGCATALFKNCELICLGKRGFLSAPSHPKELEYGYLFLNCDIKTENNAAFYLARPWRDYGLAYFINCRYDKGILEEGFNKWNDTNRDKTCRFYEFSKENYNRIYFLNKLTEDEADSYLKEFNNYLLK